MKAAICFSTGEIEVFTFSSEWTTCPCKSVRVKWLDAQAGKVVVAAKSRNHVLMLGMNNAFLVPSLEARGCEWDQAKILHDRATEAPGYAFDKSRAACWAVIFHVGQTNDTRWANEEEFAEAWSPIPRPDPEKVQLENQITDLRKTLDLYRADAAFKAGNMTDQDYAAVFLEVLGEACPPGIKALVASPRFKVGDGATYEAQLGNKEDNSPGWWDGVVDEVTADGRLWIHWVKQPPPNLSLCRPEELVPIPTPILPKGGGG